MSANEVLVYRPNQGEACLSPTNSPIFEMSTPKERKGRLAMTEHKHLRRSELFLVRLWTEDTGRGSKIARGKIQRAVSGETTHFDDWQSLIERLKAMMSDLNP